MWDKRFDTIIIIRLINKHLLGAHMQVVAGLTRLYHCDILVINYLQFFKLHLHYIKYMRCLGHKYKETYLFLHSTELLNLDDE